MTDDTDRDTTFDGVTIEGDATAREKQIIRALLAAHFAALQAPFLVHFRDEMKRTPLLAQEIRAASLRKVQAFGAAYFPDVTISYASVTNDSKH
jgi:hypothetical protein